MSAISKLGVMSAVLLLALALFASQDRASAQPAEVRQNGASQAIGNGLYVGLRFEAGNRRCTVATLDSLIQQGFHPIFGPASWQECAAKMRELGVPGW